MAELPTLEAVVFDAGGTLVRLDFEWMAQDLAEHGFATGAKELRRAEVQGRLRYDASRGPTGASSSPPLGAAGDIRAYFGGMLSAAETPPEMVDPAIDRFLARERASGLWSRPMEGARETLDAVEAMGLRRAVVSNSDGRATIHLENSNVLRGVEIVVDSRVVGFEKPDPRIFQIALEGLQVAADRALYVGDIRSVDEQGARAAGMHFVLIDPYQDYAAPRGAAIPNIGALPDWVRAHFSLSPAGPATLHRRQGG